MKFPLVNTGRRFFFFTFVVEGRIPVLSRLERGQKRPILLPAGERIVEIWRQLHKIEPHFTASNFVIMPDHVHLLLIVNSKANSALIRWCLHTGLWMLRPTGGCAPEPPATTNGLVCLLPGG